MCRGFARDIGSPAAQAIALQPVTGQRARDLGLPHLEAKHAANGVRPVQVSKQANVHQLMRDRLYIAACCSNVYSRGPTVPVTSMHNHFVAYSAVACVLLLFCINLSNAKL